MKSLRKFDECKGHLLLTNGLEITYIVYSQQFIPSVVLLEDGEHLILRDSDLKNCRVLTIRDTHKQTILIGNNIKEGKISGTGKQHVCVIIDVIAHAEISAVRITECLEDRRLVIVTLRKHFHHHLSLLLFFSDRTVFRYDLEHSFLNSRYHLFGYDRRFLIFGQLRILIEMPLERAVISFANRMLHAQVHFRE